MGSSCCCPFFRRRRQPEPSLMFHRIRNNGELLTVKRDWRDPGTFVLTCPESGRNGQLWHYNPATGIIRSKLHGFCLDIEVGLSREDMVVVNPFEYGKKSQQWDFKRGFLFNRHERYSNLVLENLIMTGGRYKRGDATMAMRETHGRRSQMWTFDLAQTVH